MKVVSFIQSKHKSNDPNDLVHSVVQAKDVELSTCRSVRSTLTNIHSAFTSTVNNSIDCQCDDA